MVVRRDARERPMSKRRTLLGYLTPDELEQLSGVALRRSYSAGEYIDGVDDAKDALYIVLRGQVRLLFLSSAGREITLGYRGEGEFFELVIEQEGDDDVLVAEAAMDEVLVWIVAWDDLLGAVVAQRDALLGLALLFREGLIEERRLVRELAFRNTRARVARYVAELGRRSADRTIRVTREEIAAAVGCRPEEVTKVLRHLRGLGLIQYAPYGRVIVIDDLDGLVAYECSSGRRPFSAIPND